MEVTTYRRSDEMRHFFNIHSVMKDAEDPNVFRIAFLVQSGERVTFDRFIRCDQGLAEYRWESRVSWPR